MNDAAEAIEKEQLKGWMTRRDGPGLTRLALQLALFVGSAVATVWLAGRGDALWLGAVFICGVALATFFPALHEAGHGTAFRSGWLNEATAWTCAVLMLQTPTFFREFHWAHHRNTGFVDSDPEIDKAPELLGAWPKNLGIYLFRASGQALLLGKAMFTLSCAVLPTARGWERVHPYIRPALRGRIRLESWAVIALWTGAVWLGVNEVPHFGYVLLAWPIAHVALGLYLMPEHTGLPQDGSQLHRTRTVRSNAVLRFFMWNMPLHAEHHAHPAVAFHALPELHRHLAPKLEHLSTGYLSFHREALQRALRGGLKEAAARSVAKPY